jgi:hypothetical protein
MTLQELKERVKVERDGGYGSYKVTITYRGKSYWCHSNNSLAWDDLGSDEHRCYYMTDKQALLAFYDECKRKNHLGEYNY